ATYEALSKAACADVKATAGRSVLYRARQALLSRGVVIDSVPGVGVKRQDDVGKIKVATSRRGRALRQVKHGARALGAVSDWNALPDAEKAEANKLSVQFAGTVTVLGSRKKITANVEVSAEQAKKIASG